MVRPRLIEGRQSISIGADTLVREHSWLSAIQRYGKQGFDARIDIGNGVYMGRYCCIVAMNEVIIGDGCVLSEHVYVADNAHGIDPLAGPIMAQPLTSKGPVRIGEGTFVGYRAIVMPGVTLGRHCVVGAGSVVTRSFPDYTMVIGNPARAIKQFDTTAGLWRSLQGPSSEREAA